MCRDLGPGASYDILQQLSRARNTHEFTVYNKSSWGILKQGSIDLLTRTVPSLEPVAKVFPSKLNWSSKTSFLCPGNRQSSTGLEDVCQGCSFASGVLLLLSLKPLYKPLAFVWADPKQDHPHT